MDWRVTNCGGISNGSTESKGSAIGRPRFDDVVYRGRLPHPAKISHGHVTMRATCGI